MIILVACKSKGDLTDSEILFLSESAEDDCLCHSDVKLIDFLLHFHNKRYLAVHFFQTIVLIGIKQQIVPRKMAISSNEWKVLTLIGLNRHDPCATIVRNTRKLRRNYIKQKNSGRAPGRSRWRTDGGPVWFRNNWNMHIIECARVDFMCWNMLKWTIIL